MIERKRIKKTVEITEEMLAEYEARYGQQHARNILRNNLRHQLQSKDNIYILVSKISFYNGRKTPIYLSEYQDNPAGIMLDSKNLMLH